MTNGYLIGFVLLLILLLSGIKHRFISIFLGPLIIILLPLITYTLPLLKIAVQSASHNTGTDVNDRFISLNPCALFSSSGTSGASCSCRVVTEFIVFAFANLILISSWWSSFPRYLWLLAKNILVTAKLGCPTGMVFVLLLNISLNFAVRVDRHGILSSNVLVTAAVYD